jgi:hypothetical protein
LIPLGAYDETEPARAELFAEGVGRGKEWMERMIESRGAPPGSWRPESFLSLPGACSSPKSRTGNNLRLGIRGESSSNELPDFFVACNDEATGSDGSRKGLMSDASDAEMKTTSAFVTPPQGNRILSQAGASNPRVTSYRTFSSPATTKRPALTEVAKG